MLCQLEKVCSFYSECSHKDEAESCSYYSVMRSQGFKSVQHPRVNPPVNEPKKFKPWPLQIFDPFDLSDPTP